MNRIATTVFIVIALFGLASTVYASGPTITPISRQIIQKNSPGDTVGFQVGDMTVNLDSLHLSATSSDTSLIPPYNLHLSGGGANRTLIIIPAQNHTGTDTIIVSVSDGTLSARDTFAVKVNAPPRFDTNLPLTVGEGDSAVIGSSLLVVVDADNTPSQVFIVIGPDSATGTAPQHGTLFLNGVPIGIGSAVSQAQINSNELSYKNDNSEFAYDQFTLSIHDSDGGIASDNGFTVFNYNINVITYNHPPVAYDTSYAIALGATLHGTLKGTDPDSPMLYFRRVTNTTKGNVTIDSVTGNFTFTPNPGALGVDSFSYQVSDSFLLALKPGKIKIVISASAPNVTNGSGNVVENKTLTDTLRATDPNVPPFALVFTVLNGGNHGSTTLLDSVSGAFQYTPNNGFFGSDTIIFQARNSQLTSSHAMFTVAVQPVALPGDFIFAQIGTGTGSLLLIDPVHQEAASFAPQSPSVSVTKPSCAVTDPTGAIYTFDQAAGLIKLDPAHHILELIAPDSLFTQSPIGPRNMVMESDGMLLIADGTAGVKRVNPYTGEVTVVSSGDSLGLALGIAVDALGNIFVSDGAKLTGGSSKMLKIDPITGHQTVIARGGFITLPISIVLDDSDNIFVVDPATFAHAPADYLYKINPNTGVQSQIVTSDTLKRPVGIALTSTGSLLVVNASVGSVFLTDTSTGQCTTIIPPGGLANPGSVYIVPSRPLLTPSRAFIHFPDHGHGVSVRDSIMVTNDGSASLVISNVASDSSEFAVTPTSATIAAGSSKMFYVTFTPVSSDSITSRIVFTSNNYISPTVVTVTGAAMITGVKTGARGIPRAYALYNNYPNPFNPSTNISFDLPQQSMVSIRIFDVLGREVTRLVANTTYSAGSYTLRFDAGNYSSGVYFYRVDASATHGTATFSKIKKMLLIR